MIDFTLAAGVWPVLTQGQTMRYGSGLDRVRWAQSEGVPWGGCHVLVTTTHEPIANQVVWFHNLRTNCGQPDLPDLLNCDVPDPAGWGHLAVNAAEWLTMMETLTGRRAMVYASPGAARYLPEWPWGYETWPPKGDSHG